VRQSRLTTWIEPIRFVLIWLVICSSIARPLGSSATSKGHTSCGIIDLGDLPPQGEGFRRLLTGLPQGWSIGVLFPEKVADGLKVDGLKQAKMTTAQLKALTTYLHRVPTKSELRAFYSPTDIGRDAQISNIPTIKDGFPLRLALQADKSAESGTVHLLQMGGETILGGNSFVLRSGNPTAIKQL
jgi:hypothetical protein